MQIRSLFVFLFLMFCSIDSSFAILSDLSCSKNGMGILFINGVNVDDVKFKDFSEEAISFSNDLEKNRVDLTSMKIDSFHNSSANVLLDAAETYFEFLKSAGISNPSLSELYLEILMASFTDGFKHLGQACLLLNGTICSKAYNILIQSEIRTSQDIQNFYKEVKDKLKENKKVIFVSHSGGAVIVDRIRDRILENDGDFYNFTSHIALARPFESIHQKVLNYSFDEDYVLKLLRFGESNVPNSNVQLLGSCPISLFPNHDFSCYLSNNVLVRYDNKVERSSNFVRSLIYKQASEFKNNDEKCCDKADGKVWVNGNSPGGFVASSANIVLEGNLIIEKDSQVCGAGTISIPNGMISAIQKSEIKGSFNLNSPFYLNEVFSSKESELSLLMGGMISDLVLDGSLVIEQRHPSLTDILRGRIKKNANLRISNIYLTDIEIESGNVTISNGKVLESKIGGNISISQSYIENSTLKNFVEEEAYFSDLRLQDLSQIEIRERFFSEQYLSLVNSKVSISGDLLDPQKLTTINDTEALSGIFFNNVSNSNSINNLTSSELSTIEISGYANINNINNAGNLYLNSFTGSNINFIGENVFSNIYLSAFDLINKNVSNSNASGPATLRLISPLNKFQGNGNFNLSGFIGENVKIFGAVRSSYSIANNTIVYGPINLQCNVSGIIYSNFECPEPIFIKQDKK